MANQKKKMRPLHSQRTKPRTAITITPFDALLHAFKVIRRESECSSTLTQSCRLRLLCNTNEVALADWRARSRLNQASAVWPIVLQISCAAAFCTPIYHGQRVSGADWLYPWEQVESSDNFRSRRRATWFATLCVSKGLCFNKSSARQSKASTRLPSRANEIWRKSSGTGLVCHPSVKR
jgi:hypothetical protein